MAFRHRLFAVQALTASRLTALSETEKAVPTLEALASAPVDLPEAGLERLQAAKRQVVPERLLRPAWPRGDRTDKFRATS
jgi:hypothetical protein